jgi:hypothetical protein
MGPSVEDDDRHNANMGRKLKAVSTLTLLRCPWVCPHFPLAIEDVQTCVSDRPIPGEWINLHADRYMQPTWTNGGLHYADNTTKCDKDGNWVEVSSPTSETHLITYPKVGREKGRSSFGYSCAPGPWTGGLHYADNTTKCDKDGNWVEVDPFTGNGAIGYAR